MSDIDEADKISKPLSTQHSALSTVLGGIFGRDEQGRPWHELTFRVIALDTDVYNLSWVRWLPWCERNATELHYALGLTNVRRREAGLFTLLAGVEVAYRQPAYLDDIVTIRTTIERIGDTSERLHHQFTRDGALLVEGHATLVWIDEATKRPVRVPDWARAAIGLV